jgi:hypothetical protein
MQIEGGIYKALMKDFKAAAATGNQISAKETRKVLARGMAAIKSTYAGATSEKGLAGHRKALAKTFRAANKNWYFTTAADRVAVGFLGKGLDGKGGSMAAVEQKLRNAIRSPSVAGY